MSDLMNIANEDHLAIVERQRAEALATIERVKALAVTWEVPSAGVADLAAVRSSHGDHGLTRSLDVAEVYARALRAALNPEDLTVRGQAEIHKPFTDDGVTYCGFDGHEGCGEVWPCTTVRGQADAEMEEG